MTYRTLCENCGSEYFEYDPQDYQIVRLHPEGGIMKVPQDEYPFGPISYSGEVTCAACGLSPELAQLDPQFDWDQTSQSFEIKVWS